MVLKVVCPIDGGAIGDTSKSTLTATVGWNSVGAGVNVAVGPPMTGPGVDWIGVLIMPLSAPGVAVIKVGVTFNVGGIMVLVDVGCSMGVHVGGTVGINGASDVPNNSEICV